MQVLELKPLQEQLDVLVAKGRIREALAVCEALDGEAQDPGIKDRLRVALGVHLCDEVRAACSPPHCPQCHCNRSLLHLIGGMCTLKDRASYTAGIDAVVA